MNTKTIGCKFGTPGEGVVIGYASVWDVVDSYFDAVKRGAFRADLARRGNTRPFLADHDPTRSIGVATFYEDERGLRMSAKLEMGLRDAQDTWLRAKAGILNGLSIGYTTTLERQVNGVRELRELELWETSAVVFPANAAARIEQVKHDDMAADRACTRLSRAIREATASTKHSLVGAKLEHAKSLLMQGRRNTANALLIDIERELQELNAQSRAS